MSYKSISAFEISRVPMTPPQRRGCFCGFFGKEVIVLGVWALLGCAIVILGGLGIHGTINMAFAIDTITISSVVVGSVIVGVGGLTLLAMLYGLCFFCQRRANRNKQFRFGNAELKV